MSRAQRVGRISRFRIRAQVTDGQRLAGLLRARHQRPRSGRASNEPEKLPPPHARPDDQKTVV